MKKLLLSLLLTLPLCGFAQKGMRGIGVGAEYGLGSVYHQKVSSYGLSFKYEYNIDDFIVLYWKLNFTNVTYQKPNFTVTENPNLPNPSSSKNATIYEVIDDGYTHHNAIHYNMDVIGAHFYLNQIRRLRPYVFLDYGIGVAMGYFSHSLRTGLGFNCRLTYNCSLQIELPFRYLASEMNNVVEFTRSDGDTYYYYEGDRLYGYDYKNNYYYGLSSDKDWDVGLRQFDYTAFTPTFNLVYTF